MTTPTHERVGTALKFLRNGLALFVEREMVAVHGDRWRATGLDSWRRADIVGPIRGGSPGGIGAARGQRDVGGRERG